MAGEKPKVINKKGGRKPQKIRWKKYGICFQGIAVIKQKV
jgi:hypothetical protein